MPEGDARGGCQWVEAPRLRNQSPVSTWVHADASGLKPYFLQTYSSGSSFEQSSPPLCRGQSHLRGGED